MTDEKLKDALNMLNEYAKSYQAYVQSLNEQVDDDNVEDDLITDDELKASMPGTTKSYISDMAHSLMSMSNTLQRIERTIDNYTGGDKDGE
ncbi:hypothetical protein [Limosilactobacillus agrestimuris]|uniref:hypothetical protein n=1 Tax=Limosilactobacillus agrestimuris TaxID=2941331 RepID=UPI00203C981D|nr:hypothetical protein [Limosilactobacillus agrestimuris]